MKAEILRSMIATAIAKKARHGLGAAKLQFGSQNILRFWHLYFSPLKFGDFTILCLIAGDGMQLQAQTLRVQRYRAPAYRLSVIKIVADGRKIDQVNMLISEKFKAMGMAIEDGLHVSGATRQVEEKRGVQ